MTYERLTKKAAAAETDNKLLELYFECKTFEEFKSRALAEHGYELKLLDPFWLAYCYVSGPILYWIVVHACCAILDFAIVLALCCLTGSRFWVMFIPMIWPIAFSLFAFGSSDRNRIITRVVRNEGIFSEVY